MGAAIMDAENESSEDEVYSAEEIKEPEEEIKVEVGED